jgi:hypothetical protein
MAVVITIPPLVLQTLQNNHFQVNNIALVQHVMPQIQMDAIILFQLVVMGVPLVLEEVILLLKIHMDH